VLEHEAALRAVELAGEALQGDVAGRALHIGLQGEHLALADALEVAMEALVDGQTAQVGGAGDLRVGFLRHDLHIE
jgi:hypothetical protein